VLGPHLQGLRNEKVRRILLKQYGRLAFFMPKTPPEFRWFGAVAVTAGICEEILWRGFLIHYFGRDPWHLGIFAAVVISSLSFASAHLYLGLKSVLGALVGGILFALLFVLTGNLLVPIIVHAVLDLLAIPILRRAPPADSSATPA
jgi:membrane protease YdiL (CAAX protease family)